MLFPGNSMPEATVYCTMATSETLLNFFVFKSQSFPSYQEEKMTVQDSKPILPYAFQTHLQFTVR